MTLLLIWLALSLPVVMAAGALMRAGGGGEGDDMPAPCAHRAAPLNKNQFGNITQ